MGTPLTFGSLFAGIGGMDLGLERAGMECKWQVEIDSFCQKVLEKHWPNVKRYGDITKLDGSELGPVDLICGGFPCQDISNAGSGLGLVGRRSGLWYEMLRIISILRPRFVIVENVSALVNRGMGDVLGGLAQIGFDAEWDVMRSCEFRAPHMRPRLFIVAYAPKERRGRRRLVWSGPASLEAGGCNQEPVRSRTIEPRIPRVAYGVANRVDRVKSVGNSVDPEVAEWIGRRIVNAELEVSI
jgi:DNA (cytosine-5)-methyltransferase 1